MDTRQDRVPRATRSHGHKLWGGWSAGEEHSIVTIFGWSLGPFIAAMVAVIVGLLAGGSVGRFRLSATHDGAMLEADGGAE